jgi:glycosyltransferase involved in cell wall biosynthesis
MVMKQLDYSVLQSFQLKWPWNNVINEEIYNSRSEWPKISIVTPSFNQGSFIEETIRSVLAQNYPNLEFIIIDGGSTDETISIIKKYESWLTYWISEPDNGQSHAINKGLEKCTGEIFNWINSDDWYTPYAFFEIANHFLDNPSIQVLSGYENHIDLNGNISVNSGTYLKETLEQTIEFCQVAQPSTFYKLGVLREITPLPEDIHYIMDGEIWIRYLLLYGQKNFLKITFPLVNFRYHGNSKTINNIQIDNFLYERSSIVTDLQEFVGVPQEIIDYWKNCVYNSSTIYKLKRNWLINEKQITKRQLRLYFINKYINMMFIKSDLSRVKWGIAQLILQKSFSLSMFKGIFKLLSRYVYKLT